jgi:LemA protein
MSSFQFALVAIASVLVFWAVGAYNRLMGLRNAILREYAAVDLQLQQRNALLQRQIETLGRAPTPMAPDRAEQIAALQAAWAQAHAASLLARARPGAKGVINSLQMAEDILLHTRQRLPLPAAPGREPADENAQVAAVEAALTFARTRFNEAVMQYNHAVNQFPTWVLAALFRFDVAGSL